MNNTPAMITTPTTCHHTLTSPNNFTTFTPKVFSKPWITNNAT